jgi:hypothetical protein
MTTSPPIAALSHLNTHARAGGGWGTESGAIYAYKALAALQMVLAGKASLRFIRWTGTCDRCDKGWFRHWDWAETSPQVKCRFCHGTGQAILRFTETTMDGGHVWHHPWNGSTWPGLDIARAALDLEWIEGDVYQKPDGSRIEWSDAGSWSPKLPAEKLPLEELVTLLNEVEDWVAGDNCWAPGCAFHWKLEAARRYLRAGSYILNLSRAPSGCFVCGGDTDLAGFCYGRVNRLFHWSLPVCKRHGEGPEKVPHPGGPPPQSLLTPEILKWMRRRGEVLEVAA